MLRIKASMGQEFGWGPAGTADVPVVRGLLWEDSGWSWNHLEASSLTWPAVDVGSSVGLSTWAAPSDFLIAHSWIQKGVPREQSRSMWHFYSLASKGTSCPFTILSWLRPLQRPVWVQGEELSGRSVQVLCQRGCGHVMAIFRKYTFVIFCLYDILLTFFKVSKEVILQFFSFLYFYKITLNSKSNINAVTKLVKQKKNLSLPSTHHNNYF